VKVMTQVCTQLLLLGRVSDVHTVPSGRAFGWERLDRARFASARPLVCHDEPRVLVREFEVTQILDVGRRVGQAFRVRFRRIPSGFDPIDELAEATQLSS